MRTTSSGLRFAAVHCDLNLGLIWAWRISGGYDENTFGNFMWLRALALKECGIYDGWKKWEQMRRNSGTPLPIAEAGFVPLSFERSDIHLHFYMYLACIFLSVVALVAEIFFLPLSKLLAALQ